MCLHHTRSRSRHAVSGLGITLLAAGVALLGFVPYALFATAAPAARAQSVLSRALAQTVTRVVTRVVEVPETVRRRLAIPTVAWPESIPLGTPVARLSVPAAGVRGDVVVQGTDELRLEEGPGHYPGTALPGQPGNLAIAGHRTTWLRPFYDLQAVRPGDHVLVSFGGDRWVYTVAWVRAVPPTDVAVAAPTRGWDLTLTTCNPRYSAAERLVVRARLDLAATLDVTVPSHSRVVRTAVVRRLAVHPEPIPAVPSVVLAAWAGAVIALVAAVVVLRRRTRLALVLLLPAALCCLEGYGAAVRLLPPTW